MRATEAHCAVPRQRGVAPHRLIWAPHAVSALAVSTQAMGVFHGMRAHTRWINNGKDHEKLR